MDSAHCFNRQISKTLMLPSALPCRTSRMSMHNVHKMHNAISTKSDPTALPSAICARSLLQEKSCVHMHKGRSTRATSRRTIAITYAALSASARFERQPPRPAKKPAGDSNPIASHFPHFPRFPKGSAQETAQVIQNSQFVLHRQRKVPSEKLEKGSSPRYIAARR